MSVLHLKKSLLQEILRFEKLKVLKSSMIKVFSNSQIRYFQCKRLFDLHEALCELKFTSLKAKLLLHF